MTRLQNCVPMLAGSKTLERTDSRHFHVEWDRQVLIKGGTSSEKIIIVVLPPQLPLSDTKVAGERYLDLWHAIPTNCRSSARSGGYSVCKSPKGTCSK